MFNGAFSGPEHRTFTLRGTNGCAAVLVHGFPGTPAEMRAPAHLLHEMGWTAHAPLLPGFGADIGRIAECGLEEWRDAVVTAIETARRDHARVLLMGHSMGGALAIDAAARVPVDRLLLFCPFYDLDSPLWKLLPVLSPIFREIKPFGLTKLDFSDPETRKGIRQFMPTADLDDPATQEQIRALRIPTRIFDQIRQTGQAAWRAAPSLRVEALVIQGDADDLVKPDKSRALAARLHAQFDLVPGEHNLPIESARSWPDVSRLMRAFVGQITPAPERPIP